MEYNVTLNIDYFDMEKLARIFLLDCLSTIEHTEGTEMVDTWDAINQVLAHISTPDQLKEMELRPVPKAWMEIVLEHDRSKAVA